MVTTPVHLNNSLSVSERVQHLLSQLTLEEKIAQLQGVWASSLINKQQEFDYARTESVLKHGAGHIQSDRCGVDVTSTGKCETRQPYPEVFDRRNTARDSSDCA